MTININELKASLNKAFRLISPLRKDLDQFKQNLQRLLGLIDEKESEENVKIHLMDFLKNTFYNPDHLIATKGKTDFVIHLGKEASSPAGVLFEVKRPSNKADMITQSNLNTKAMHELILYYLRERSNDKNNSITHLVITNIYEWFIFDAHLFENIFKKNSQLLKSYNEWENKQKVSSSTDLFYKEIAKPFLELFDKEISFTYFDLRKYLPLLKASNDNGLIPLYKFFTPTHLLKLPFLNDSNSLDKGFFNELLHIIGLEEVKDGGRKIIRRLPEGRRHPASFIENTINILEVENAVRKIHASHLYGSTADEQLFNVGLELSITWINRILFLKLLEAQLLKYHSGERKYRFLNQQIVNDYDELYKLFFQVLAKQGQQRTDLIQKKYSHIPYLNSSLFEFSELEDTTFKVNSLDDNLAIDLYPNSVLKKAFNYKNAGTKNTLHYLFDFLDAYDFASVGKEEVQEDNKTIINASVLGLVFEKINGYKDGSIYTPGAITTFLCRETIRKAVVKKFNDLNGWNCESLSDVKNHISDKRNTNDILRFNRQLEEVKIVDPAVGSGHFLVSSLNELIHIKSELGILADASGNRLTDIEVSIANDELVVMYSDELRFFDYTVKSTSSGASAIGAKEQRIQKTLFEEKRKIIESCLFGVDINPNSVKICRLRLWIELLKHTYYKPDSFKELETLPNIDINIKQGNSLLSKYSLNEDLSEVLRKQKFGVKDYQLAVEAYKEAPNKEAKEPLKVFFNAIKDQFRETVGKRDPRRKRLSELRGQLSLAQNNFDLFGQKRSEKEMELEVKRISLSVDKIETEIKEIESNIVYRNAFEWRFEFPEVWNEKGEFEGFEVVIGNPPYIQLQKMGADADALQKCNYETFERTGDIYCLFYEQAIRLLKPGYYFGFITSNKWMRANYGQKTRKFFLEQTNPLLLVDFGGYQVFESATVDTNILISQNAAYQGTTETCLIDKTLDSLEKMSVFINQSITTQGGFKPDDGWVILSPLEATIKNKIEEVGIPLKDWGINIYRGILTGYNEAFIIDQKTRDALIEASPKNDEIIRPILRGRDIHKYWIEKNDQYLLFIPWHFPLHHDHTIMGVSTVAEEAFKKDYKAVYEHLLQFKDPLERRNQAETGIRYEWYALQRFGSNYWQNFYKPKIIYPEITKFINFYLDTEQNYFVNNKCFVISGQHLEYLTAFFNSSIFKYCFLNNFPELMGGTRELRKIFFDLIPVLAVNDDINESFKNKVKIIQQMKDQKISTINEEKEIDRMLFDLYNLTEEEREVIGFIEI